MSRSPAHRLGFLADCGIGATPLVPAKKYARNCNLWVKLEKRNPTRSIKDRLAYHLLQAVQRKGLDPSVRLVDSTSGNLGLAMMRLAPSVGRRFVALADPSIAPEKLARLRSTGSDVVLVEQGDAPDLRSARIAEAQRLSRLPGWFWTNQYANEDGVRAHYETTGPEIWRQSDGCVDVVVCSVGTGGTICGLARFLKEKRPRLFVVAVEPSGSTIFGGKPAEYLNAGAGMRGPSALVERHRDLIDAFCRVPDEIALRVCREFRRIEDEGIGLTSGAALYVGAFLARRRRKEKVVVVSPDGWRNYRHLESMPMAELPLPEPDLRELPRRNTVTTAGPAEPATAPRRRDDRDPKR